MAAASCTNKVFFFVSYEGTRDHRVVDTTVTIPTPAMLRGDFQGSDSPIYDPLSGNADGTGRTQFQVFPGDPNYALCNTASNPQCLNIIPAARMDPIAQQIASHIPANNIDRESRNYFAQAPFESDRRQVDTKVDYNVNSKFNLAGTFGRPPLQRRRCRPSSVTRRSGSPLAAAATRGTVTATPTGPP